MYVCAAIIVSLWVYLPAGGVRGEGGEGGVDSRVGGGEGEGGEEVGEEDGGGEGEEEPLEDGGGRGHWGSMCRVEGR